MSLPTFSEPTHPSMNQNGLMDKGVIRYLKNLLKMLHIPRKREYVGGEISIITYYFEFCLLRHLLPWRPGRQEAWQKRVESASIHCDCKMKPLTINVYLLTFTVLANTATPTKSMLHIEQLLRQHSCFVNSNDCHHDDVLWTENRWKIRGDSSFNIEGQAISGFVAAASSWIHPRSGWKRFTWQNRRVCPSSNGAICHMLSPAQYGGG